MPIRHCQLRLAILIAIMKVEAAPKAFEGRWPEVSERVEQSLAERSVEDPEFWQWKDAMFRRHEIDISAFLRLAGG